MASDFDGLCGNVDDIERVRAALEQYGFTVNFRAAMKLWQERSEEVAASWLGLPDTPAQIVEAILEAKLAEIRRGV